MAEDKAYLEAARAARVQVKVLERTTNMMLRLSLNVCGAGSGVAARSAAPAGRGWHPAARELRAPGQPCA
jgi:hypothetical protein